MVQKVPIRNSIGEGKEYYCYVCPGWTKGSDYRGTGFPQMICPHCGLVLDGDYRGYHAYERGESKGLS